jgi:sensor histidine kinase YesM
LGSIQYYIEKAEIDIANDYLSDFASLMRLILESSQKESIDFRQEKQILELYLKLEHLRFDEKFDYELIADNEIEFDFQMPTMIIQPFIENAINHGLYHLKERKGKLKITFQQVDEDHIKCVIEDNGVGREESQKLRRSKHVSRGMQIVKERIQALKSSGAMEVSLDIEDQYENQNPVGTKIQIDFIYQ